MKQVELKNYDFEYRGMLPSSTSVSIPFHCLEKIKDLY